MVEGALIRRGKGRCDPLDQLRGNLVEEPRRLGGLILAEHPAARGAREDQLRLGARKADVTETAFLLELLLVLARTGVGEQPFLEPGDDHGRELQPLGRVHRHHPDLGFARARLLVRLGQQRQPVDEPAERRLLLARLVFAGRRDELHQVLDPLVRLFAVLVAKRLEVSRPIEHLAHRDRHGVLPRDVSQPRDQIAEHAQRRCRAGGELAVIDRIDQLRPERARRADLLEPGRQKRRRIGEHGVRVDCLQRVHHPLADASRGHVDHAPQADVVVRVHDQLQVGERVLDFLALVEPHAADDLVGDALPHQRVFDGA